MLLREFWNDRFWPYCMANLRESTRVGYESAWRLHVMPYFGGMDMGATGVRVRESHTSLIGFNTLNNATGVPMVIPSSGMRYKGMS